LPVGCSGEGSTLQVKRAGPRAETRGQAHLTTIARMEDDLRTVSMSLGKGGLLRLRDPLGKGVGVVEGLVWVTQDGDPRDIFVEPGESFVFDRPGLAIVQALAASQVLLFELPAGAWPTHPRDVTIRGGAA
jgi:hypothetical protein